MRVTYPLLPAHRQAEARAIARRTHQTFLFAAVTGVLVGLVVVGIDKITVAGLLEAIAERPLWMRAMAPAVGLVLAAVCLRWIAGSMSTTTADEYVRSFHDQAPERIDPRPVVGRVLASIATIGYGGGPRLEG